MAPLNALNPFAAFGRIFDIKRDIANTIPQVVTIWMLSNFILAAAVLNVSGFERINTEDDADNDQNSAIYLNIILWSVAGLAAFRFCKLRLDVPGV